MSVLLADLVAGNLDRFDIGDGSATAFQYSKIANAILSGNTPTLVEADWWGVRPLYSTARTNLRTRSQEINTSAADGWSHGTFPVTVTADQTTAPDGTLTADLVVPTVAATNHAIVPVTPIAVVSGQVYTMSFYVKPYGAQRYIAVHGDLSAGRLGTYVGYDLVLGTITGGTGATITAVGGGWFKITQTMTAASSGNTTMGVILRNTSGANLESYAGNVNNGFYLWGVQLESGNTATPYIPTAGAAVTVTDYTLSDAGALATAVAPLAGAVVARKLFDQLGKML